MEVTLLGTGTAIPEADRFPSSALIKTDEQTVLVDIGPGILRRMAQAGLPLEDLDTVLITHFHTDHTADLPALLFALRSPRYKHRPPLHIYGPPGLQQFLQHLTAAWPWVDPEQAEYHLMVRELAPGPFEMGEMRVTAVAVEHTANSMGYRIEAEGGVAAFSGDADECPGLLELAKDADLFVCDCAFPDGSYTAGHLTPSRAGRVAAEANCRKLVLTHFYPECAGQDLAGGARSGEGWAFGGDVVLGEDLQRFQVP